MLASLFQKWGLIRGKRGPGLVRALLQTVKSPSLCVGITHLESYHHLLERQDKSFSWSAASGMAGLWDWCLKRPYHGMTQCTATCLSSSVIMGSHDSGETWEVCYCKNLELSLKIGLKWSRAWKEHELLKAIFAFVALQVFDRDFERITLHKRDFESQLWLYH